MNKLSLIDWGSLALLVIGGLNWGLLSINQSWNVVSAIFGDYSVLSRIVYGLVGISAVYILVVMGSFARK